MNMAHWALHMQKKHACIGLILFNIPKGDTQLTYFWWAKFFTCRVAWALFGQVERDYKEIKEHQTTQPQWARTSEVGQRQCTISHLQTVNIYSVFPGLGSHWTTDECCENTLPTHNWWLTVCSSLRQKKKAYSNILLIHLISCKQAVSWAAL